MVAEGVENAKQLAAVARLGVDCIQGYLVARPMPFEDLQLALVEQPWRAAVPLPPSPDGGSLRVRGAA